MALEITVIKDYNTRVVVRQINFNDPEINEQIDKDEDSEDEYVEGGFDVYYNPFGNCQTFCVAYGNNLNQLGGDPESVRLVLRTAIEQSSMKQQGMFDIRQDELEEFIENISPWALKIHQMPYISSNESEMCVVLVHFNHKLICK